MNICKNGLYFAFLLWFGGLSYLGSKKIDSSEKFRFFVYDSVSAYVSLLIIFGRFLQKFALFRASSGVFAVHCSSLQAFVILMMFAHWPYEYAFDAEFGKATEREPAKDVRDFVESGSSA
jgi:hypothetical protein